MWPVTRRCAGTSAAVPGEAVGGLICTPGLTVNNLASDGGVTGFLSSAAGVRTAACWNAANEVTEVPLPTGEQSATGWDVASVVELTCAGLLVANLRNAEGLLRPATWRLGR